MPPFPAEIDLFTVPHSRMKELVNKYTFKVQDVDYRNCQEVCSLLKELQMTLHEFKSHESIENMFIMDQLKNRLKQNHIYNSAVCDCHNDNRLQEMLTLVKSGKKMWKTSIGERLHYGHELQKAFNEFVQMFLPHMEEEENIFQPLLVEHFDYDELKILKQVVLEQHELIKDPLYQEKSDLDIPEMDSDIKDFRDLDSSYCCIKSLYDDPSEEFRECLFEPQDEDEREHFELQDKEREHFELQDKEREHFEPQDEEEREHFELQDKEREHFELQDKEREHFELQDKEREHFELQDKEREHFELQDKEREHFELQDKEREHFELQDEKQEHFETNYKDLQLSNSFLIQEELCLQSLELPVEILVKIFQFLDPPDRGRCAQVSLLWNEAVYSTVLWKKIYPIQWARGLWELQDMNLSSTLQEEGSKLVLLKTADEDADVDECEDVLDSLSQKENDFFTSFLSYFLPRVGNGVEKIVLDGGQGMSPRLLHQTLVLCPNVIQISATYTFFDYYTLKRLSDRGGLRKLKKLDIEGCENMDDRALVELSRCLLPRSLLFLPSLQNEDRPTSPLSCRKRAKRSSKSCYRKCKQKKNKMGDNDRCFDSEVTYSNNTFEEDRNKLPLFDLELEIEELSFCHSSNVSQFPSTNYDCSSSYLVQSNRHNFEPTLQKINLSGCWRCTNDGLTALLESGCLKNIRSLNLSSCFNLSGETLLTIAKNCLRLEPESLTYCCNIANGPYSSRASGCDSISHPLKFCCRNNYKN